MSGTSPPPADPLAAALRAHYGNQPLSRARMDRLRDLADAAHGVDHATAPVPGRRRISRRAAMGIGVMALAAGVALAVGLGGSSDPSTAGTMAPRAIAEEIALNHRKNLAVEFATPSYRNLGARMRKLDFHPIRPAAHAPARLIGARYCSIRGSIAAQVKVADPAGRVHTLYQTRWIPTYRGVPDRSIELGGVKVRFWREGDVLLGLASARAAELR